MVTPVQKSLSATLVHPRYVPSGCLTRLTADMSLDAPRTARAYREPRGILLHVLQEIGCSHHPHREPIHSATPSSEEDICFPQDHLQAPGRASKIRGNSSSTRRRCYQKALPCIRWHFAQPTRRATTTPRRERDASSPPRLDQCAPPLPEHRRVYQERTSRIGL